MRFPLPAVVAATILIVLVAGFVPAHADRLIINWQDGSGFDSGVFPEWRAVLNNHKYDSVINFPVGTARLGLMDPDGSLSDVLEVTHSISTEICFPFNPGSSGVPVRDITRDRRSRCAGSTYVRVPQPVRLPRPYSSPLA